MNSLTLKLLYTETGLMLKVQQESTRIEWKLIRLAEDLAGVQTTRAEPARLVESREGSPQ